MNRLELIQNIEILERRKVNFQNVLKDVESRYFNSGKIFFDLETSNFNRKYGEEKIHFDNVLMKEYLKKEIDSLETKINEKINLLRG